MPIYSARSLEQQLEFLCRVHGLERLVLIAHQSCAFYRDWLRVAPGDIEAQQIDDLTRASTVARRIGPKLIVEACRKHHAPGGGPGVRARRLRR